MWCSQETREQADNVSGMTIKDPASRKMKVIVKGAAIVKEAVKN